MSFPTSKLSQSTESPMNTAENGCGNGFSLVSALSQSILSQSIRAQKVQKPLRITSNSTLTSSNSARSSATRNNPDVFMVIQDVLDILEDDDADEPARGGQESRFPRQ